MRPKGWVAEDGACPVVNQWFSDFIEIFDYISRNFRYTINTNGTLITPKIAKLMKRKGAKTVSIYGADAKLMII